MYARDISPSLAHTCTDVYERQRLAAWPKCTLSFLDVSTLHMGMCISFLLVVAIVLNLACISSASPCIVIWHQSAFRHCAPNSTWCAICYLLYPEALVI